MVQIRRRSNVTAHTCWPDTRAHAGSEQPTHTWLGQMGTINGIRHGTTCWLRRGRARVLPSEETRDTGLKHPLMNGIADARCACDPVGRNWDPRLDHAEEGSSVAAPAVHVQGRGAVGDAG
jgi:hypothetical protein